MPRKPRDSRANMITDTCRHCRAKIALFNNEWFHTNHGRKSTLHCFASDPWQDVTAMPSEGMAWIANEKNYENKR